MGLQEKKTKLIDDSEENELKCITFGWLATSQATRFTKCHICECCAQYIYKAQKGSEKLRLNGWNDLYWLGPNDEIAEATRNLLSYEGLMSGVI